MTAKSKMKRWLQAMKKLPSLPDETEHYREVYSAVSPKVLQEDLIYDAITELFDSDVIKKLISIPAKKEQFNMLALGLGEGMYELHMLKKLSSHFASIRLVAVDPNKGMLQSFCERLNDCDVNKIVECHPFRGTYAEFLKSSLASAKFNLITAIHSLYYMRDLTKDVERMLSSLDNAGIFYADVFDDANVLGKEFKQKPWLTERTPFHTTTMDEVQSIAEKNGYRVTAQRVPITLLDCSSILDESSVFGNQILDFFTMTPHFRRDAPQDIVEDTLTFWRENLSNDQGKLTACGDDGLLIISK